MQSPARVAAALVVMWAASACDPFGDCESDRIAVAHPVSVQFGNISDTWDLAGQVYDTNLDPSSYAHLVDALIEGSRGTAGAVWTLDQGFGSNAGWLAVKLGGDVSQGQVITVTDIFTGGGWGMSSPSAIPASVGVHVGTFEATSVSGTLTVLTMAPLSLAVHLSFGDGQGGALSIEGDMGFTRVRESVACD